MLSMVSCSSWPSSTTCEATPAPDGACTARALLAAPAQDGAPLQQASRSWLLRLGANHGQLGGRPGHISRTDRARHVILAWRLKRPYLLYCCACSAVTAFLLGWNLLKGVQNSWNLPQWQHHRWEEALEVSIGILIVAETLLTMRVLGVRAFLDNGWCMFDLVVALLTVVSIGYGLEHLGRKGEICEANVPLLMLRFLLQPARVLAALASTIRTREMQSSVDELTVDFSSLSAGSGAAFEAMEELQ